MGGARVIGRGVEEEAREGSRGRGQGKEGSVNTLYTRSECKGRRCGWVGGWVGVPRGWEGVWLPAVAGVG